MAPTNELRFVERIVESNPCYMSVSSDGSLTRGSHTYRVLQQRWVDEWLCGEWRDVPLELKND